MALRKDEIDDVLASFFAELARDPANFVLARPPRDHVLYEDNRFRLVELPLPDPDGQK